MHFLKNPWFWGWVAIAAGCSGEAGSPGERPNDLGGAGDSVGSNNGSGTGNDFGGSSSGVGNAGSSSNMGGHAGSSTAGNNGTSGSSGTAGRAGGGSGGNGGGGGAGGSGGRGGNGGMAGTGGGGRAGGGGSGGSAGTAGSSGTGGSTAMACRAEPTHSGGLTQYDPTPLGNCGMPWPSDDLYAAISTADYMNSAVCGMCVEVTGPAGEKTTVHVADQCPVGSNPKCTAGHIDLSHKAYNATVHTGVGEVPNSSPVSWRYVPCGVSGNIVYHFKDGTSSNWAAVQIRNSRYGIAKISYRFNGSWRDMDARTNALAYFIANSTGLTTFDLRVTDVNGQVLEDDGVQLVANGDVQGHAQFPVCK
jgi:expansin